jgi:hypothetical protein
VVKDLVQFDMKAFAIAIRDDNPLALLPPQLASSVVPMSREIINTNDGQFDGEVFIGYDLPAELDAAQARTLLERFESALPPVTIERLAAELTRVRLLTKGRNLDETDAELTVQAFAEELAEYPGQLVIEVLRYWPRSRQWFPTWQEFQELLRLKGGRMLAMIEALRARSRRREGAKGDFVDIARGIADALKMDR